MQGNNITKHEAAFHAASYLILTKGGKILLQKRAKGVWMGGKYGMPAGHIEGEETVFEALAREVMEEIGIAIREGDVRLVHVMHRVSTDHRVYFDFFYKATKWSGTIENREPDKHDKLEWFALDKLPTDVIPYLKRTLEHIERGVFFSEDRSDT